MARRLIATAQANPSHLWPLTFVRSWFAHRNTSCLRVIESSLGTTRVVYATYHMSEYYANLVRGTGYLSQERRPAEDGRGVSTSAFSQAPSALCVETTDRTADAVGSGVAVATTGAGGGITEPLVEAH